MDDFLPPSLSLIRGTQSAHIRGYHHREHMEPENIETSSTSTRSGVRGHLHGATRNPRTSRQLDGYTPRRRGYPRGEQGEPADTESESTYIALSDGSAHDMDDPMDPEPSARFAAHSRHRRASPHHAPTKCDRDEGSLRRLPRDALPGFSMGDTQRSIPPEKSDIGTGTAL